MKGTIIKTARILRWHGVILMFSGPGLLGATNTIDSLKTVIRNAPDKTPHMIELTAAWLQVNPDSAIRIGEQVIERADREQDDLSTGKARILVGRAYYYKGEVKKVEQYMEEAKASLSKTGDKEHFAHACYYLGYIQSDLKNNGPALQNLKKAAQLYKELNMLSRLTASYNNIGVIYMDYTSWPDALHYFLESSRISAETNDSLTLSGTSMNISMIHREMGEFKKSLDVLPKAIAVFKAAGDSNSLALAYEHLASAFQNLESYDSTIFYHKEAVKISHRKNNSIRLSLEYTNLAQCYEHMHQKDSALHYYQKAIDICLAADIGWRLSSVYHNIAVFYLEEKKFRKALDYALKSEELARKTENIKTLHLGYDLLAECYAGLKQYDKAFHYADLYSHLLDSTHAKKYADKVAQMQVVYETEQKEQEITLLSKDRELQQLTIDKQRSNLYALAGGSLLAILLVISVYNRHHIKQKNLFQQKQAAMQFQLVELEQKALRSQMNPHFIFNCMGSIQGLITDGQVESACEYLAKFAKLLRRVLEHSAEKTIGLAAELENLQLYMELEQLRTDSKFTFDISIDEKVSADSVELPPLLIQPIAENAIWHGIRHKKNKGHIHIEVKHSGHDQILCSITDDGVGRSRSQDMKTGQHKSFGMKISAQRMKLLRNDDKNNIRIIDLYDNNQVPKGTRVEIKLPA